MVKQQLFMLIVSYNNMIYYKQITFIFVTLFVRTFIISNMYEHLYYQISTNMAQGAAGKALYVINFADACKLLNFADTRKLLNFADACKLLNFADACKLLNFADEKLNTIQFC